MASHQTAFLIRDLFNFETEIKGKRILEVGSATWPWESIKERFKGCREFISIDLKSCFETDFICDAEDLVNFFGPESFELVISLFTIEHVKDWKKVISNFKNVCTPGGIIFISTCTQHFPYHDDCDAWRFEVQDIYEIFSDCFVEFASTVPQDRKETPGEYVFAKIKKPHIFVEMSLDQQTIFNINYGKRI